ncbi:MAG: HD domain-containing phosphohydrolase [Gammaproteobacteria bacterium]|jgi:HD-GYP domain-containing protein (c-di-GMP phosphodiesterase class II)
MKNNKQLWATRDALKTALMVSGGRDKKDRVAEPNQIYDAPFEPRAAAARGAIIAANKVLDGAAAAVSRLIREARKDGSIDVILLEDVARELLESHRRVPNAIYWALVTRRNMPFLVRRALGCAVNALALGCFIDMDDDELIDLAVGALLLDIGKIKIPVPLLAKARRLSEEEASIVRRHVEKGARLLESVRGLSASSLEMVRQHHERIDGSGYPEGLTGDEISLFGKIAGIVDTYDAQCLKRWYARSVSAHDALRALNDDRGRRFDADLVDKFICAVGVFPTGTWVQLVNGYVGLVCLQSPNEPMNPQVALVEGPTRRPIQTIKWLTLADHSVTRALQPSEQPDYFEAMEHSLQSTVYGIWPR